MASKYIMSRTIKETDPERYQAICNDLKAGKSLAATMRDNHAGSEAVARIKEELLATGDLKNWKKRTAGKAAMIVDKLLDKLDREADTIKAREIPLAAAVLIDKSQVLLSGGQTVVHKVELGESMANWLGKNAAPSSTKTVDAEIIPEKQGESCGLSNRESCEDGENGQGAVSYTHLTLPTLYSV